MTFECPHCAAHISVPANMAGRQMYCPTCGQLMALPADVSAYPPGTALPNVRFAGFWIRFLAALLDTLVVLIPSALLNVLIPVVGGFIAWVLYKALCLANWDGQTVGKKACGIKVVSDDFRPITNGQAWGRALAEIVSSLILYIGYLMAAFTDRKQALHDKIAGTVHIYA